MVTGISSNTPTTPDTPKLPTSGSEQIANKETFLKLLVAQIKNQNPLAPSDGVQFLTQLAQFSSLEQTMQTNTELQAIHKLLADASTAAADATNNTSGNSDTSTKTNKGDTTKP